jgi:hypothetical protein
LLHILVFYLILMRKGSVKFGLRITDLMTEFVKKWALLEGLISGKILFYSYRITISLITRF